MDTNNSIVEEKCWIMGFIGIPLAFLASLAISCSSFLASVVIREECVDSNFASMWAYLGIWIPNSIILIYKCIRSTESSRKFLFSPLWPLSNPANRKTFVVLLVCAILKFLQFWDDYASNFCKTDSNMKIEEIFQPFRIKAMKFFLLL